MKHLELDRQLIQILCYSGVKWVVLVHRSLEEESQELSKDLSSEG